MEVQWEQTSVAEWLNGKLTSDRVRSLTAFLEEQGTFHFRSLPSGLFPAAASDVENHETTGYANVWLRDNIQIASAHHVLNPASSSAADCVRGLLKFYTRHRFRFRNVIEGRDNPQDPMNRPHIRFDGEKLRELPEKWSHAQNDALGYFLWLTCRLVLDNALPVEDVHQEIIGDLVRYWETIRFWEDEDSGHWEETRKVSASSIGTAVAGLTALRQLMGHHPGLLADTESAVNTEDVDRLIEAGTRALDTILPSECIQNDPLKKRTADAALLFLIYPLNIVSKAQADDIIGNVREHLMGPIGIRRYVGDSYWCADYKSLLSAEVRTSDFSDDMTARDQMLRPGTEAQWCIFDPILSCIFGARYREHRRAEDLQKQIEYLRRSLAQLTLPGSRFGAWRCPESYFMENGTWVPNDITPLLWTQANLRQALHHLCSSLED
ncbi:MAG: glycoside hydrolase family 15 protein [Planctomyces sp.]